MLNERTEKLDSPIRFEIIFLNFPDARESTNRFSAAIRSAFLRLERKSSMYRRLSSGDVRCPDWPFVSSANSFASFRPIGEISLRKSPKCNASVRRSDRSSSFDWSTIANGKENYAEKNEFGTSRPPLEDRERG